MSLSPTLSSCHLLVQFQASPVAQGLPLGAGRETGLAALGSAHLELLPVLRSLSLPSAAALWGLGSLLLPSSLSCLFFYMFYLRIPNLFSKFPFLDLCMFHCQHHRLPPWSGAFLKRISAPSEKADSQGFVRLGQEAMGVKRRWVSPVLHPHGMVSFFCDT